jgi:hypothetical protein
VVDCKEVAVVAGHFESQEVEGPGASPDLEALGRDRHRMVVALRDMEEPAGIPPESHQNCADNSREVVRFGNGRVVGPVSDIQHFLDAGELSGIRN